VIGSRLALRFGAAAAGRDPFNYAVETLGFVRVRMIGSATVIEFDPATASDLAVTAAFYEIAERAPELIVLMCRGVPDRFEIFRNRGPAFRRIEELTKRDP
jgi:hypothetical protein